MTMKTIKIYYNDDETGPAQLLSKRLARIIDTPVLGDLCRNCIVRLDGDPDDTERIPGIAEVLYSPYPCRSWVYFQDDDQAAPLLLIIMGVLGADAEVVAPPKDGKRGIIAVSHDEPLDPVLLARAIGMPQDEVDGDEDTNG